jgi:hypothetical protein
MSKSTRPLAGASQKKYFRELFGAQEGVTPEAAAQLLAACEAEIAQVRVRLPLPERGSAEEKAPSKPVTVKPAKARAVAAGEPSREAFDPFAFSLVVVMTKGGASALNEKLSAITDASDLRAIAKAQHVGVPPDLVDPAAIRHALIEGTERRIADRRAAAS